jgi:hypothetical protein
MDRSISLKVAAFAGALIASSGAVGCTDDGASLHVICAIRPEINDEECVFDPGSDSCVVTGVMNLAAARQYGTALTVESGLKARQSSAPPRAEPNRLALTGGTVEIRKANGAPIDFDGLKNPYDFQGSGTAEPGGRGFMSVTLIPKEYADRLRANAQSPEALSEVILAVTVRGRTDGEVDVESNEWLWPVRLTYESPVEEAGSCLPISYCISLAGIDDFANACLCSASDATSCHL